MSVYPPPTENVPIWNPSDFPSNSAMNGDIFDAFRLTTGAIENYKLKCVDSFGDAQWKPSVTSNVIEVSPSFSNAGLQYNSIYAACEAAFTAGASSSVPYEIRVYPGSYLETNKITVYPGISIIGDASRHMVNVTYTGALTTGAFFTFQGDSFCSFINIVCANLLDYACEISGTFTDAVFQQMFCFGANIAGFHETSVSFGNVYHIGTVVFNIGPYPCPLGWLIEGNVKAFIQLSAAVDLTFAHAINGVKMNSTSANLSLSQTETDYCDKGLWVVAAATCDVGGAYFVNCNTGLYVEAAATSTINLSAAVFSSNTVDINANNGSCILNTTGCIVSPNKYTPSANSLAQFVSNDIDSRYSFELNNPTYIEETYNGMFLSQSTLKAFKYNTTTYTDVSSNIKQSGATTTSMFSALTAGYIFYLGNTAGKFPSLLVNMSVAGSMGTIGTNYVWEYWNGAAWTSFNTMGLSETYPYQSYANTPLQNTGQMSIRFDQTFSSSSASDWATTAVNSVTAYWVRVRIITSITTSPVITWIKEFDSTMRIHRSGTIAYFGRSMPKVLKFYDVQIMAGNATNQTLYVNAAPAVNRILTNNSFSNAGTATSGLSFLMDGQADTSSGLYMILSWLTDGTNTNTVSLTISWTVTSDGDIIATTVGTAPTNATTQTSTFTLTPTITAGSSRQVTSSLALPIPAIAIRNSSGTLNKTLWVTLLRNASSNTDRWVLAQISLLQYVAVNTL